MTTGSAAPLNLHTTAAERLRRDGQRYTDNRRALVEVLDDADRPLTIPELLERRGGLPQSSAYRNLAVLERAGVVERVVTTDEFARYELAEDLTEHHHHLICSGCGEVNDVVVPPAVERRLDEVVTDIGTSAGYRIEGHRFDVIGRCAACVAAAP
jgi:Fur family transcriptional regulator, ferric uptake regulator